MGRPRDAKCLNAVPSASADRAAQMGPRVGLPFKGRQLRQARRRGQKANSYVARKGGKGETREGRGAGGEARDRRSRDSGGLSDAFPLSLSGRLSLSLPLWLSKSVWAI